MAADSRATVLRARVLHTPRDPFADESALECHENGAVAFKDGEMHVVASLGAIIMSAASAGM